MIKRIYNRFGQVCLGIFAWILILNPPAYATTGAMNDEYESVTSNLLTTQSVPAYSIRSTHPRLLVNSDTLPAVINNFVVDGSMDSEDVSSWANEATPTLKEKADFGGNRRLHLIGNYGSGARQYLNIKPGIEYRYNVSVYLVSGRCKAQLYQDGKIKVLFDITVPTGQWQTFTGTFTPQSGETLIRFYGYDSNSPSEFYIDDVSLSRTNDKTVDRKMEYPDCTYWLNESTPLTKEKTAFGGTTRLHVVGNFGQGVRQYLNIRSGVEYKVSVTVYLANGRCKGQLYQTNKQQTVFDFSSPTGSWQTFTVTYIPQNGPTLIRLYGYNSSGSSEFYVSEVSVVQSTEKVVDKNMELDQYAPVWGFNSTPTLVEKAVFSNNRCLHIKGGRLCGAIQYLDFKPSVEYEYSVKVYVVSGRCAAQLYEENKQLNLYSTNTVGQWQTFTGRFTPIEGRLRFRFFGYDDPGIISEFYIDDVSFKPVNGVDDSAPFNLGPLYRLACNVENNGTANPSPATFANQDSTVRDISALAMVAMASKESRFVNLVISYALAIANVSPSYGTDWAQRERVLSMAYAYDWLYPFLTDQNKETLRAAIVSHLQYLDNTYGYISSAAFTVGHSRYCNTVALGALIALYNEYASDTTYCNNLLATVVDNWVNGFNPFQGWVASSGGGYFSGWGYGASYVEPQPYQFWNSATGETWGSSWRSQLPYFQIYGYRPDQTIPAMSDAYESNINNFAVSLCVVGSALGNPFGKAFVNSYGLCGLNVVNSDYGQNYLWQYIYMNDNNTDAGTTDISALSKARSFGNSGYVVARDKWYDQTATQLIFKCTPFYVLSHQHKDQNSFVLFYKGPLLLDSGSYDVYLGSHGKNYYTRTIAHNSMVVYDPSETFVLAGETLANDGGQKFADENQVPVGREPETLEEITNYDKYKIDGITAFTSTSSYCYMKGDASKAYNSSKVNAYTREITMTYASSQNNNKPLINIKDHVVLNKTLTPAIVFHSKNQPTINILNKSIEIANDDGGGVRIEVVNPANVNLTAIGGSGYEFWVNGINYPPTMLFLEPGAWRVEVTPTSAVSNIDFEFNLKIYDAVQ